MMKPIVRQFADDSGMQRTAEKRLAPSGLRHRSGGFHLNDRTTGNDGNKAPRTATGRLTSVRTLGKNPIDENEGTTWHELPFTGSHRVRLGPGPVFAYEWLTTTRRWQLYAMRAGFVASDS